ncbi:MAG: MoaD/ThiS family protein [Methanomicrobiales archaeon]|nr:MoaD/ThiS family protein [Methanomicrobiales archaeon]
MKVRIRFFARFRELLGSEIMEEITKGTSLAELVRIIALRRSREGYDALFDRGGTFHPFVIIMRNGVRLSPPEAEHVQVSEGDDIAIFPPVAGG